MRINAPQCHAILFLSTNPVIHLPENTTPFYDKPTFVGDGGMEHDRVC